jgi:hypothetical protein
LRAIGTTITSARTQITGITIPIATTARGLEAEVAEAVAIGVRFEKFRDSSTAAVSVAVERVLWWGVELAVEGVSAEMKTTENRKRSMSVFQITFPTDRQDSENNNTFTWPGPIGPAIG